MRQCHYGDCGQVGLPYQSSCSVRDYCICLSPQCLQMAVKLCWCGRKEKSVACSSEYLCEAKCQRVRQCGMHQCRRKVSLLL